MDWFLYDNGPRHERVKGLILITQLYLLIINAWKVSVVLKIIRVFMVSIFPHSDWIRRDMEYLWIGSKCEKIWTIKTPNVDTFHAVYKETIKSIHIVMQK